MKILNSKLARTKNTDQEEELDIENSIHVTININKILITKIIIIAVVIAIFMNLCAYFVTNHTAKTNRCCYACQESGQ